MNNGSKNVFAQALSLRQQISEKKRSSNGNWYWECYLPGPISFEDTETIMRMAGCWCEDNDVPKVRFYTNQNHSNWAGFSQMF